MRRELQQKLFEILEELELETDGVSLEHPAEIEHGDYATNAALVIGNREGVNPREIAEKIREKLEETLGERAQKITVEGPGFVNIFLANDVLRTRMKHALTQEEDYGKGELLKGTNVMVEYTDPNPFKVFHIGHMMSNAIGESLARIVEWNGATVKRACYQGDVGMHVAMTLWGIEHLDEERPSSDVPVKEQVAFLGRAYAKGATAFKENEDAALEIKNLNKKIYENDADIRDLYEWGREVSLDYFEKMYERLGTTFDLYFFESESGERGKETVLEHADDGVFELSDNAYIFPGEKYDLHTRVFINSEGFPTYESKELGLAEIKYEKFKYDRSLVVTGNEVNDYFTVLLKAMSFVFPELREKTTHIGHGMLRLPEGKMSSRTGDVIAAEDFINEIYHDVYEERMKGEHMPDEEKHRAADQVAVAAVKFSILKQGIGKDVIFKRDEALSFEGDSGPYLQYTYVRARSVLRRARKEGHRPEVTAALDPGVLERLIARFPDIVERAYHELAPQLIVHYLLELSSHFNRLYAEEAIIGSDPAVGYRLARTEAVAQVIQNGLSILGIETPERM